MEEVSVKEVRMDEATLKVVNKELRLAVPLQSPRPSKSGKTNIVYSTGGFIPIESDDGKKYNISINLTTPKDG